MLHPFHSFWPAKGLTWAYYLIPFNASTSGLSTAIPLYLLNYGGGVKEVALAIFLSAIASTIGSLLWGKLIDRMRLRTAVIIVGAASLSILAVCTYFASDISVLILISTMVGFLTAGIGPVTNVFVMERSARKDWVMTSSWITLATCAGIVIAMLAGYLWLMFYQDDARSFAIVCSGLAMISIIMASTLSRNVKPASYLGADKKELSPNAANQGIKSWRSMLGGMTKRECIFLVGLCLYFISGNLFFTPYTPFLKENGISDSEIFLAYTILHLSKVIYLPFNSRATSALGGENNTIKWAYVPRLIGILSIAAFAAGVAGNSATILLTITFVAFIAIDVSFSMWHTATTALFMRGISLGNEGKMFGINGGVVGIGLFLGSVIAGEAAPQFGYTATFSMSAGLFAISFIIMAMLFKNAHQNAKAVSRAFSLRFWMTKRIA
ncbi:MFS transporter [Candidatus Nitrososphaera gargensis]|uniref:MFS transporter n=1 Tax=Candidatus Nitrososphaera gargensis TaxID=497727 RepID=UPI001E4E4D37|nr:MFS transporter [Candidatus Nitrososphaera gargensis]